MSDVHIAALQMDIAWQDPRQNMLTAEAFLSEAGGIDLCLLPEMWCTGFVTAPESLGDVAQPALSWMKAAAARYGICLCGTVPTAAPDGDSGRMLYYNRMYFVRPDGDVSVYDKRHLFRMGNEHLHYSPGHERVVATLKGMRFLLLTCYDLRFPVWIRNRDNDYDAILIAANWPQVRREAWDTLLKARAIENQCFVIAANRVGNDPNVGYNGGSIVLNPKGNTLVAAADGKQQLIKTTITLEERLAFINKFNTFADADAFCLSKDCQ